MRLRRSGVVAAVLVLCVLPCCYSISVSVDAHGRSDDVVESLVTPTAMRNATTGFGPVTLMVTATNATEAKNIARGLLQDKLAACVNIVPSIVSMYWWEGKIEEDNEVLLIIKSRKSLVNSVTQKVKALHSADVPEVIALDITSGNPSYLAWLKANTLSLP